MRCFFINLSIIIGIYEISLIHLFFLHADLGSSFWGMVLILASTNLLTARIAAGCFVVALLVVLLVAKNVSSYKHPEYLPLVTLMDV